VQAWRQAHPGYWKREGKESPIALQEDCLKEPVEAQEDKLELTPAPLQEDCFTQHPLMVGLIAMLTSSTLQEDIVGTRRRLVAKGQEILGMTPGTPPKHDEEKTLGSRTLARTASPI
jgi:hypothetical protein